MSPLKCVFVAAWPWAFFAAWTGAALGGAGYDPESTPEWLRGQLPGIVTVAGLAAGWTVVMILAMPVLLLINEGRYDWRRVRIEGARLAIAVALMIALTFVGIGGYRLAGSVTGGWPGGFLHGAVGALIGALIGTALGVPANLVAARLRIEERPGIHPSAEPVAVEREAEKDGNALPRRDDRGWTTPQLALVLMLAGAFAVVLLIKCLVFGPPPYSRLAYLIGPLLIVVGYLVDPHPIRSLQNERRRPPAPPSPGGG